jgi:hypothetical protein
MEVDLEPLFGRIPTTSALRLTWSILRTTFAYGDDGTSQTSRLKMWVTRHMKRVVICSLAVLLLAAAYGARNWEAPLVVVKFKNDLTHRAVVGLCKSNSQCTSTRRYFTDAVAPGQVLEENASADNLLNNFIVTGPGGRVLGCAYLKWKDPPRREPVVTLTRLVHC